jgi:radical SAM protein with 4Fe4S-binding SPASM domain
MEKYDAMLKTLRLIMDDPCDGCRWLDRCPGECPVFDRVRDVLYGRNG